MYVHSLWKHSYTSASMTLFMNNQKVQQIQFTPSSAACAYFANVFFGNVLSISTLIACCKGQPPAYSEKVINKQIQRQRPHAHTHHTQSLACECLCFADSRTIDANCRSIILSWQHPFQIDHLRR